MHSFSSSVASAPAAMMTPLAPLPTITSPADSAAPHHRAPRPFDTAAMRSPTTPTMRRPVSGWSFRSAMRRAASVLAPTSTTSRVYRPLRRAAPSQAR